MRDMFSFVILLRVLYSAFLIVIAAVVLREVWILWFDRPLTFGEVKYFDGVKVDPGAADRFRHLLSQEYARSLGHIRQYKVLLKTGSSADAGDEPNLLRLKHEIDSSILARATSFEAFRSRRGDFVQLDMSFQGIDVRKLLSSVRAYLSPSVDLNLIVTKIDADGLRASIAWPREGRPLRGALERYNEFELGPQRDDVTLARRVSTYLLWLQFLNGRSGGFMDLDEFDLWVEGLEGLRLVGDRDANLAVNAKIGPSDIAKRAEPFAQGFAASFNFLENYIVGATLLRLAGREDAQFRPDAPINGNKPKINPELLGSLLNYYYVHLVSDPVKWKGHFQQVATYFADENTRLVDPFVVGKELMGDRVVPWSKVVEVIKGTQAGHSARTGPSRLFSVDIGHFGFPEREVPALFRVIDPEGTWTGTGFLIAPNVVMTSKIVVHGFEDPPAAGRPYVEQVKRPYDRAGVTFRRIEVAEVVDLDPGGDSAGAVALKLAEPVVDAVPFALVGPTDPAMNTGSSVYLLSYLGEPSDPNRLDVLFNAEFERPVYLGATLLLQSDVKGGREYAYNAFTLPGASGSPVLDAKTGKVFAIHNSGLRYSTFAKIGVGLDVTNLRHHPKLKPLLPTQ